MNIQQRSIKIGLFFLALLVLSGIFLCFNGHVRNVKHLGSDRCFREASHLSSAGDLDMYEIMKAVYETCPDTYIRPDHGRMIWDEVGRPGYGLYDRALGLTYLNGLWEAICKDRQK